MRRTRGVALIGFTIIHGLHRGAAEWIDVTTGLVDCWTDDSSTTATKPFDRMREREREQQFNGTRDVGTDATRRRMQGNKLEN